MTVALIGPEQLAQLRKEAMQTEPEPQDPQSPVVEAPSPSQEELDAANARVAELEAENAAREAADREATAVPTGTNVADGGVVVSPTGTEEPAPAHDFNPIDWLHRLAVRIGAHDLAAELPAHTDER